jgi:RNA recognition motif-containing protein
VYVGNVAPDITEAQIREAFAEFGDIVEIKVQGEKGYCFVVYGSHQNAADAIINAAGYRR